MALGALYVANGTVNGWRAAYDISVQITSPAEPRRVPVLAWPLAVAGWLLVPALAGAVAGYVVNSVIETHRSATREPLATRVRVTDNAEGRRTCKLIPLLGELCRPDNRFTFNPHAGRQFIEVHGRDWRLAQSHLEVIVQDVLTSNAVNPGAYADEVIFEAVTTVSSLLLNTPLGERCPLCSPTGGTSRTVAEGAGA